MAVAVNFAATYPLMIGGFTVPGYAALYALVLNLVVAVVLTPVLRAISTAPTDVTAAADYVSGRA
jgi:SSS family solute:Na+ symporter